MRRTLLLAVMALVAGVAVKDFIESTERPLANTEPVVFEIARGQGLKDVALALKEAGVIDEPWWLMLQAWREGLARRLQSGEYEIPPGLDRRGLLALFASGKVRQHAVTLVEGWTFRQMLAALRAQPALEHLVTAESDGVVLMRVLGIPEGDPEGRFFPDTYFFTKGTSDVEILKRAHRRMATVLAAEWARRAPDLPYRTPDDALIMASIIEKETALPAEKAEVAGVLVRRLRTGMPLQVDPTVIYGLGDRFDGNLRREHLKADTPYNTYLHRGLPPAPIAAPGLASLRAALNPAPGDSLYYVARGDGGHRFSRTWDEHRQAVELYQKVGQP
ncbi:endolytic transglycosylase MltG [Methylococcus capsulatus]|uniref:endolytic transglycosylase MltG n=1 Tax=Methylococcus capsulatus TaxID=414 RepID=UPI00031CED1B|nr:endolytic transglycosylase MltG [Methylococcus capsulatus]QXP87380.1 endolytic transglycosylase MltG [Methylococcus capsulatus]QXP92879.1 endolytic transglycosylase MltG [Methylococcus capsulatus]UQN12382.1 endolytic transglycosylase MltG [Methylococcus capsulatus]